MSDPIPNFEQALESDIKHLESEVKLRREHPEYKDRSSEEILRESIRAMGQAPGEKAPNMVPAMQPASSGTVINDPLPDYAANAPAETKLEIEHLLETAFREGIMKANAHAASSSPFVMDAFHDALVGKLYPEFKKRGILE